MPKTKYTLSERFWSKVEKTKTCWVWRGCCDQKGYGHIKASGKNQAAHRVSFKLHFGSVPKGTHVLHKCDNPPCIRPDHLFSGTASDNSRDASIKGRLVRGEHHHSSKLRESQVVQIRKLRSAGATLRSLAERYNVSCVTVHHIHHRLIWKHV
jgi:hypothetical protein